MGILRRLWRDGDERHVACIVYDKVSPQAIPRYDVREMLSQSSLNKMNNKIRRRDTFEVLLSRELTKLKSIADEVHRSGNAAYAIDMENTR